MTIETFLSIVGMIGLVIGYLVYQYCRKNICLTYKEQKVGGTK